MMNATIRIGALFGSMLIVLLLAAGSVISPMLVAGTIVAYVLWAATIY